MSAGQPHEGLERLKLREERSQASLKFSVLSQIWPSGQQGYPQYCRKFREGCYANFGHEKALRGINTLDLRRQQRHFFKPAPQAAILTY